jgi:hypothetical protein
MSACGPSRPNFSLGPDVSFRGEAEVGRAAESAASVESDPNRTLVAGAMSWQFTTYSITQSARGVMLITLADRLCGDPLGISKNLPLCGMCC